jgi:hypothetical protein
MHRVATPSISHAQIEREERKRALVETTILVVGHLILSIGFGYLACTSGSTLVSMGAGVGMDICIGMVVFALFKSYDDLRTHTKKIELELVHLYGLKKTDVQMDDLQDMSTVYTGPIDYKNTLNVTAEEVVAK